MQEQVKKEIVDKMGAVIKRIGEEQGPAAAFVAIDVARKLTEMRMKLISCQTADKVGAYKEGTNLIEMHHTVVMLESHYNDTVEKVPNKIKSEVLELVEITLDDPSFQEHLTNIRNYKQKLN